jgi:hypothetical protein
MKFQPTPSTTQYKRGKHPETLRATRDLTNRIITEAQHGLLSSQGNGTKE